MVRRWLFLLVSLWGLLGLGGCQLPEPTGPGVQSLTQGELLLAGETYPTQPPTPGAAWQAVTLPDAWDTHRPDYQGHAWYRLRFVSPDRPSSPLAVYLPYVSMNAQVSVNGQLVGVQGRLQEPVTRHFYTPLIFNLPPTLLKPAGQTNELQVLLMGYRQYRSGLGVIHVGDAQVLQASWSQRHFWQNTGTLITSVIVLTMGVYGAVLWVRSPRNTMFAWFTAGALVWGVRNLNFVLVQSPWSDTWDNRLWNQWSLVGAVAFVGLFALFTLEYSRWVLRKGPLPRWQFALPLAYVGLSVLLLAVPGNTAEIRQLFKPIGAGALALTLWSQWHLLSTAVRARSVSVGSVAVAGLVYIALMASDLQLANDHETLGGLFLRQYAAVPLFLSVTLVWTQRYWEALQQSERLSHNLQEQVDIQRAQLEKNFEQLVASERAQVLSQERERLVSDLHDGLGLHLLTALRMARSEGQGRVVLAETIQDCLDDLRVAIDSMSNLDDRDPVLILGSLRFRLAPRLQAAGVQLDWQVLGDIAPQAWLDAPNALHLLRIVQEAVTNAVRHGHATRVLLRVEPLGQGVGVAIIDNGVGLAQAGEPGGHGLGNMRRRAQVLGATLSVQPHPDGGTAVTLSKPADWPESPRSAKMPG